MTAVATHYSRSPLRETPSFGNSYIRVEVGSTVTPTTSFRLAVAPEAAPLVVESLRHFFRVYIRVLSEWEGLYEVEKAWGSLFSPAPPPEKSAKGSNAAPFPAASLAVSPTRVPPSGNGGNFFPTEGCPSRRSSSRSPALSLPASSPRTNEALPGSTPLPGTSELSPANATDASKDVQCRFAKSLRRVEGCYNHGIALMKAALIDQAAITIQRYFRGCVSRRLAAYLRQLRHWEREVTPAVVRIQSAARRLRAMRYVEFLRMVSFHEKRRAQAASRVQIYYRSVAAHRSMTFEILVQGLCKIRDAAARDIQRLWRGYCARKVAAEERDFLIFRWIWDGPGQRVDLVADFTLCPWQDRLRMKWCNIRQCYIRRWPKKAGRYEFKYLVNGNFVCDGSLPVQRDIYGNVNNMVEVPEQPIPVVRKRLLPSPADVKPESSGETPPPPATCGPSADCRGDPGDDPLRTVSPPVSSLTSVQDSPSAREPAETSPAHKVATASTTPTPVKKKSSSPKTSDPAPNPCFSPFSPINTAREEKHRRSPRSFAGPSSPSSSSARSSARERCDEDPAVLLAKFSSPPPPAPGQSLAENSPRKMVERNSENLTPANPPCNLLAEKEKADPSDPSTNRSSLHSENSTRVTDTSRTALTKAGEECVGPGMKHKRAGVEISRPPVGALAQRISMGKENAAGGAEKVEEAVAGREDPSQSQVTGGRPQTTSASQDDPPSSAGESNGQIKMDGNLTRPPGQQQVKESLPARPALPSTDSVAPSSGTQQQWLRTKRKPKR